ncbi:MAG: sensor histidine kinase [Clostridiaceae bacterium]
MDIKLKRFNGIKAGVFILCVVMFLGSFVGFAQTLKASSAYDNQITIDDALLYDNYKDGAAFQREFNSRANDILYILNAYKSNDTGTIEQIKNELSGIEGLTYYATDGVNSVTNLKNLSEGAVPSAGLFEQMPCYLIYQNDSMLKLPESATNPNERIRGFDKVLESKLGNEGGNNLKLFMALDSTYMKANEAAFAAAKAQFIKWISMSAICAILSLISLIYLLAVTGKADENGERRIFKIDKIFTEFQLAIIAIAFVAGGAGFMRFLFEAVNYEAYYNGAQYVNGDPFLLSITMAAAIGLGAASIGLAFILSCVRNLKVGRFLENSLIYKVITSIWRSVREIYYGGSVMNKVVLVALAICLLSATVFMAPVVFIGIVVVAPKWVKKYEGIKKGVDEVKKGNLTYKIPADGKGELDLLAGGINEISEASNIAVQNELKNQRLKTDLISNVSHDLKTPLTSIITYVDLLKREGLESPEATKYLDVLDKKSQRLQKLTEDLFDAAKASSGAIPVKFERVDMLSLVRQGLGEMEDKIRISGLDFRINAQKDNYYVRADGQLLWRVMENLLNNVLKYAQEGSRVYIDLREQTGTNNASDKVILEMKNISRNELNIDAEELMERFRRGDESRATEGSGLGLAIAKDLVTLQNGKFEIKIDGDMFKAIISLESLEQRETAL